jgi:hypothetical protein
VFRLRHIVFDFNFAGIGTIGTIIGPDLDGEQRQFPRDLLSVMVFEVGVSRRCSQARMSNALLNEITWNSILL